MRAKVVEIISGSQYTDKRRRVTLRFEDGDICFNKIQVPEESLGMGNVVLDDVIEFATSGQQPPWLASSGGIPGLVPSASPDGRLRIVPAEENAHG